MLTFLEFLAESSWKRALYHGTQQEFDPTKIRPGTHFGDLGTAVERARDTSYGQKNNNNKIMAYDYKPTGKSIEVKDNWKENQPERSIAKQLQRKGVLRPKIANFIAQRTKYPQKAMERFLKQKGISHVTYKNHIEGDGSASTIVYDTKSLSHKKTFDKPNILDPKKEISHRKGTNASNRIDVRKKVFGTSGRNLDK